MKKYYFVLNEDAGEHIGVVGANNDTELNLGIKEAIEAHFDYDAVQIAWVEINKVRESSSGSIDFPVIMADNDDMERMDDDDSTMRYVIEIQETWLY